MREHIEEWLNTAVSGIRFGPDRRAVEAELREHIEDKTADLRRIFPDIPPNEARDRALAGMGDAEEIKVELAKVHRPWLGYLWWASRAVAAATLFVLAIHFLGLATGGIFLDSWVQFTDWSVPEEARVATLEPSRERVKINGFTITMTEAVLWTHVYPDDMGEEPRLTINLRQSSPCFWLGGGRWHRYVSAEDSAGNYYPSYEKNWSKPRDSVWEYVWDGVPIQGLFHTDHRFMIPLVDPDIEWMRLDYSHMGRSFSFTVDLKGAGT